MAYYGGERAEENLFEDHFSDFWIVGIFLDFQRPLLILNGHIVKIMLHNGGSHDQSENLVKHQVNFVI